MGQMSRKHQMAAIRAVFGDHRFTLNEYFRFEVSGLSADFVPVFGTVHFNRCERSPTTMLGANWRRWFLVELPTCILAFRLCKSGDPGYQAYATGHILSSGDLVGVLREQSAKLNVLAGNLTQH